MQWKILELCVLGDSQLVIRQVNDDYKIKDEKLMPYKRMVDDSRPISHQFLLSRFPKIVTKLLMQWQFNWFTYGNDKQCHLL